MQFANRAYHTLGGTSAGKALHLEGLGVHAVLHTQVADDPDGRRIVSALQGVGVEVFAHRSSATERHVNLLSEHGERVSLYVSTPSTPTSAMVDSAMRAAAAARIAVIDLGALGAQVLGRLDGGVPVWTDLHDYDGKSAFHELFLRSAEAVFMNADAVADPWALLEMCVSRGPKLAVCTKGADGAIALTADGERAQVPAVPTRIDDTNGAGDAFFAGLLASHLAGASLPDAMAAAARQAAVALSSPHLHPALEEYFPA